jgi:hypothetical protein
MTKLEIDFVKGLMEGVAERVATAKIAEHEYRKVHKPHPEYVKATESTTGVDNTLLRDSKGDLSPTMCHNFLLAVESKVKDVACAEKELLDLLSLVVWKVKE